MRGPGGVASPGSPSSVSISGGATPIAAIMLPAQVAVGRHGGPAEQCPRSSPRGRRAGRCGYVNRKQLAFTSGAIPGETTTYECFLAFFAQFRSPWRPAIHRSGRLPERGGRAEHFPQPVHEARSRREPERRRRFRAKLDRQGQIRPISGDQRLAGIGPDQNEPPSTLTMRPVRDLSCDYERWRPSREGADER